MGVARSKTLQNSPELTSPAKFHASIFNSFYKNCEKRQKR